MPVVKCPKCGTQLNVRALVGNVRCSGCGATIALKAVAPRPTTAAANSPPLGVAEWYYLDLQGQQQGPVTRQQMGELARTGGVFTASLVWKEGMAEWQALGQTEFASYLISSPIRPPLLSGPTTTNRSERLLPKKQREMKALKWFMIITGAVVTALLLVIGGCMLLYFGNM